MAINNKTNMFFNLSIVGLLVVAFDQPQLERVSKVDKENEYGQDGTFKEINSVENDTFSQKS